MKQLGMTLLSASALLAAGTASAALPEWTYVQAGYYQADSQGDNQTDAYTLNASISIVDLWHVQAGYINGSLGLGPFDNDFDGWNLTIGAHPAITESTQLVLNAIYYDNSIDGSEGSSDLDSDGYGFGVGFRSNVTDKVEAGIIAYWTDIDGDSNGECANNSCDSTNISIALSGRYNWTESFSTGATVVIGGGAQGINSSYAGNDSMNLDVRWTFGGTTLSGPNSVTGAWSDSY